jgi:hypothetical protein
MSAFDEWYNGLVGFHINSERILDDFKYDIGDGYPVDPKKLERWMKVCWNNALEAAQERLASGHHYWSPGDDHEPCPPGRSPLAEDDIECLRAKA